MTGFDRVRKAFAMREWIMEGRGSYPYNDDRYKEEVRYLFDEVEEIIKETWAHVNSKSFEYRQQIIAQYHQMKGEERGAVWVKASEFKTHTPIYRTYRKMAMEDEGEYDYGEIFAIEDDGRIYLDADNECNSEHQSDERWIGYEILSAAPEQGSREAGDWISVDDRLPQIGDNVMIYNTEGAILIGYMVNDGWVAFFADGEKLMGELTATHWMPLPEPPVKK